MKKIKMLLISLALLSGGSALADDVAVPTACEYWLDYQFDARQRVNIGAEWDTQLDISALAPGLHVLGLRVADSRGRWGYIMLRHFYKLPILRSLEGNVPVSCEYWIDYDHASKQATPIANGQVAFNIDVHSLPSGLHTLHYQTTDATGQRSPAIVHHFVIPQEVKTAKAMAAYEYWFNHGPRVHVDVDPQNPLELSEVMIDVKDVWPNAIGEDYRLDVSDGTVYVDDNVFFGIQALDDLGHASQAVLSDTFAMTVPVYPQWVQLAKDTPTEAVAPEVSHVTGFKMATTAGDILCWEVEGSGGTLRLHNADGSRLEGDVFRNADGRLACAAKAASAQTYALLYDASMPNADITATCKILRCGDVNADHTIDVADIATVISRMSGSDGVSRQLADVNGDGIVDVADIATVISIMAGTE